MPLFTLKSYHRTACTVGLGMVVVVMEGGGATFSSESSSQSMKEHLNTHSKSYLTAAVLLKSFFQSL